MATLGGIFITKKWLDLLHSTDFCSYHGKSIEELCMLPQSLQIDCNVFSQVAEQVDVDVPDKRTIFLSHADYDVYFTLWA